MGDPETAMAPEPVKIVLERRARPGAGERLVDWIRKVVDSAKRSRGLEGSSVLTTGSTGSYIVLLRFDSQSSLDRWNAAEEVRALMAESDSIAMAGGTPPAVSGFETWFQLPGLAAPTPPAKWKMALVTWVALLPQVLALGYVVPGEWHLLARVALSTAIPVALLTWILMPRLTRLLYRWLYAVPARPGEAK